MRYFLRITLIIAISVAVLTILFSITNRGFEKYYKGRFDKYYEMFRSNEAFDVLLLGSSRTHRNIDPKIFDSVTGLTFYNGGISGARAFEMNVALKGYLEVHPPPKYVILNYDLAILETDAGLYNPIFYYNFFDNKVIYKAIEETDNFAWLYKHVPFMQFVKFNDDIRMEALKGVFGQHNIFDSNYKGYAKMAEPIGRFDTTYSRRDSVKSDLSTNRHLNNIIDICKRRNIEVLFFVGPVYDHFYDRVFPNYTNTMTLSKQYAEEHNIQFYRFDSLSINNEKNYFKDNIHLSESGTQAFSLIFSEFLKRNILGR